ncbi:hypothetical protein KCU77_g3278, partial [Aureobasidium melanogenum]
MFKCLGCARSFPRREALSRHELSCSAKKDVDHSDNEPQAKRQKRNNDLTYDNITLMTSASAHDVPEVTVTGIHTPANSQDAHAVDGMSSNTVMTDAGGDSSSRSDPKSAPSRRGRYVSQACLSCQKRKIKCSGEDCCTQCQATETECVYTEDRRRKTSSDRPHSPQARRTADKNSKTSVDGSKKQKVLLEALAKLTDRIAALERERESGYGNLKRRFGQTGLGDLEDNTVTPDGLMTPMVFDEETGVRGQTSILDGVFTIEQHCTARSPELDQVSPTNDDSAYQPLTRDDLPQLGWKRLQDSVGATRSMDAAQMNIMMDDFFAHCNPLYPVLHENTLRDQYNSFMGVSSVQISSLTKYHLAAQLNLVCAIVKILKEDCPNSRQTPGWQEYCRAEDIMYRLSWIGNRNLMTVQCLILRTLYLLYLEKLQSTYDAIGRAVRLCFRLGYHVQKTWQGCSPLEVVMRQRVFWTVMYLERRIAFNCGCPYLIRDSDYNVDYPKSFEDKLMFADKPLPEEDTASPVGPYLVAAAKWSKLCSEIWDRSFSLNAPEKHNSELIASTEARLLYLASTFAPHLRWSLNDTKWAPALDMPAAIQHQRLILFLRLNQMRLSLRQETMLNCRDNGSMAEDCFQAASSSIDALVSYIASPYFGPMDRFSITVYATGALSNLGFIITNNNNPEELRKKAIRPFSDGVTMLTHMAPGSGSARHCLQRMYRTVHTVRKTIDNLESPGRDSGNDFDAIDEAMKLFLTSPVADGSGALTMNFDAMLPGDFTLNATAEEEFLSNMEALHAMPWLEMEAIPGLYG